jgi:hypothetical protein
MKEKELDIDNYNKKAFSKSQMTSKNVFSDHSQCDVLTILLNGLFSMIWYQDAVFVKYTCKNTTKTEGKKAIYVK